MRLIVGRARHPFGQTLRHGGAACRGCVCRHSQPAATLVRATAGLTEDLGIECVVEGVETEEQLQALTMRTRLLAQGYLVQPATPGSEGLPAVLAPGD